MCLFVVVVVFPPFFFIIMKDMSCILLVLQIFNAGFRFLLNPRASLM